MRIAPQFMLLAFNEAVFCDSNVSLVTICNWQKTSFIMWNNLAGSLRYYFHFIFHATCSTWFLFKKIKVKITGRGLIEQSGTFRNQDDGWVARNRLRLLNVKLRFIVTLKNIRHINVMANFVQYICALPIHVVLLLAWWTILTPDLTI